MKTVVRVFLFMSLLIMATFVQNVPVAACTALRLPASSSACIHHRDGIRVTCCDEPGTRTDLKDSTILPEFAVFESESEDSEGSESNFAKKLAAVTGLQTGRFDAVPAVVPAFQPKCSPICGHFSCKAPRFIRLRVIRI